MILYDMISKGKGSVEEQNSVSWTRCLNKYTEEPLQHRLLSIT